MYHPEWCREQGFRPLPTPESPVWGLIAQAVQEGATHIDWYPVNGMCLYRPNAEADHSQVTIILQGESGQWYRVGGGEWRWGMSAAIPAWARPMEGV
jgi:hypothetical protein